MTMPAGQPVLLIQGPGWTKRRCAACAGEAVQLDGQVDAPASKSERVEEAAATAMVRLVGGYQPGLDLEGQR